MIFSIFHCPLSQNDLWGFRKNTFYYMCTLKWLNMCLAAYGPAITFPCSQAVYLMSWMPYRWEFAFRLTKILHYQSGDKNSWWKESWPCSEARQMATPHPQVYCQCEWQDGLLCVCIAQGDWPHWMSPRTVCCCKCVQKAVLWFTLILQEHWRTWDV